MSARDFQQQCSVEELEGLETVLDAQNAAVTRITEQRNHADQQVTAWQGVSGNLSTRLQAASDAAALTQAAVDRLRGEIHAAEEQAPAPDSPQQRPSSPEYESEVGRGEQVADFADHFMAEGGDNNGFWEPDQDQEFFGGDDPEPDMVPAILMPELPAAPQRRRNRPGDFCVGCRRTADTAKLAHYKKRDGSGEVVQLCDSQKCRQDHL
ncbi:hypothetical protein CF319_g9271 [Tilletia indica]|nr:hypothetical protein CF319_g9271 [Tilletia indica]